MEEILDPSSDLGIVSEENSYLAGLSGKDKCISVRRMTFWRRVENGFPDKKNMESDLIGYVLLKTDLHQDRERTHVFESVFRHEDGGTYCLKLRNIFQIRAGVEIYSITGAIYAQQNGWSKSCVHACLYSLLSTGDSSREFSFTGMNSFLKIKPDGDGAPLDPDQVGELFRHYGIPIHFYEQDDPSSDSEYRHFLYSGIESGGGALVFFRTTDPNHYLHAISLIGHLYDPHSWSFSAENAYSPVSSFPFIHSDNWASAFIANDDNFGPELTLPKQEIRETFVCGWQILPKQATYTADFAENIAFDALFSLLTKCVTDMTGEFSEEDLSRMRSLLNGMSVEKNISLVFRSVCMTKSEYFDALGGVSDWTGSSEDKTALNLLKSLAPDHLWVVEFSRISYFQTESRKIGEVVLDAGVKFSATKFSEFIYYLFAIRLPGYWFLQGTSKNGSFYPLCSKLHSLCPVFGI